MRVGTHRSSLGRDSGSGSVWCGRAAWWGMVSWIPSGLLQLLEHTQSVFSVLNWAWAQFAIFYHLLHYFSFGSLPKHWLNMTTVMVCPEQVNHVLLLPLLRGSYSHKALLSLTSFCQSTHAHQKDWGRPLWMSKHTLWICSPLSCKAAPRISSRLEFTRRPKRIHEFLPLSRESTWEPIGSLRGGFFDDLGLRTNKIIGTEGRKGLKGLI